MAQQMGANVAIEALGLQRHSRMRSVPCDPSGTLSSLGIYCSKLALPYDAFAAGIGDYEIVTTLCPGAKERMLRPMKHGAIRAFSSDAAHYAPF